MVKVVDGLLSQAIRYGLVVWVFLLVVGIISIVFYFYGYKPLMYDIFEYLFGVEL